MQEREVSGTIHSSRPKGLSEVSSSEGQRASGKPDALLSSEQGNLIRSSVFRNANPSSLRGSLLEGDKDRLRPIRQDQTWQSKNFMSNLSKSASVNNNDKRKSKDWHHKTHNTDLLNLDENKFDYKKTC